MTAAQAKALRAPFNPEQIGKLPKPTKKENPKGRCDFCGGWHGLPAVHLDYVGHAAVTDRLLAVDPEWTWEPAAIGPNGEPLSTDGGLWIKLTVAGVTRYGYGDSSMGKGPKEMIGDAIRNAAMRFGVALDLWAKEGLGEPEPTAPASTDSAEKAVTKAQHAKIGAVIKELDRATGEGADWVGHSRRWIGEQFDKTSRAELTTVEAGLLIDHLEQQLEASAVPFGRATRKVCDDCGGSYYNLHAHLEECPGRLEFAGYYRCDKCGQEGRRQGYWCPCGGERLKVMQPPPRTSWGKAS